MGEALLGVALFTAISLVFVSLIMGAKALLIPAGDLTVTVNGERKPSTVRSKNACCWRAGSASTAASSADIVCPVST